MHFTKTINKPQLRTTSLINIGISILSATPTFSRLRNSTRLDVSFAHLGHKDKIQQRTFNVRLCWSCESCDTEVIGLTDMETPYTLQESQTRVSSSGVDKSAYSATEDPGSISVEELPLCLGTHRAITRNLVSCGEHLEQVGWNGGWEPHYSLDAVKSTPLSSLSCWEVGHPHIPETFDLWFLASSSVVSGRPLLPVSLHVLSSTKIQHCL